MDYAKLATAFLAWLKTISPALHDALLVLATAIVQKQLQKGQDAERQAAGLKDRLDLEAELRSLPDNELTDRMLDTERRIRTRLVKGSR